MAGVQHSVRVWLHSPIQPPLPYQKNENFVIHKRIWDISLNGVVKYTRIHVLLPYRKMYSLKRSTRICRNNKPTTEIVPINNFIANMLLHPYRRYSNVPLKRSNFVNLFRNMATQRKHSTTLKRISLICP